MADKKGDEMNNETCTVTIADIYGAEWWKRNKEELDREWEWEFRLVQPKEKYAIKYSRGITINGHNEDGFPRIILHRRKPKPPTLREVYGTDEVTVPVGWEWTGEWRVPTTGEKYTTSSMASASVFSAAASASVFSAATYTRLCHFTTPRLILKPRTGKVWFKAEERSRELKGGEWVYTEEGWLENKNGAMVGYGLCATRHEEIECTHQVVTQAMVDGVTK